jgi:eukaryotic-like serine/threonine-protein kinase
MALSLSRGATLGSYEVSLLLGKGGMGEVWRASDTRLGRDVAIKTLPGEFSDDAERLTRFEREAKVLASLNHPNIASIYGLEASSGTRFLVLELVEGDTLADVIKRGPLAGRDRAGHHPRYRGLHGARASAGTGSRSPC